MRAFAAAVLLVVLSACIPATVQVVRTGPTVAARAPDCRVSFLRAKAPELPFDELAVLQYDGIQQDLPQIQELLRKQACAAGADAIVVTREYVSIPGHSWMTGSAIRYHVTPGQRALLDSPRNLATETPPAGYRTVVVKKEALVYPDAELSRPTIATLPEGTVLWRLEGQSGAARPFWDNPHTAGAVSVEVWLPDGRTGYVVAELLAPYEPPAPSARPDADGAI